MPAMAAGIAIACLALSHPAAAEPAADELKARLLAQARAVTPEDYAFARTVRSESTSGGKTEKHVSVETFDPTKPAESRWTLLTIDGSPPSEEVLRKFRTDSAKRRVSGYGRLAAYLGAPATTSKDAEGRTVFHFAALPKGTVTVMDSDVSEDARADAVVGEAGGVPFVEELRVAVKPTRLKLVMKLRRYETVGRYHMGPEGKPMLAELTSDMSGSGLGVDAEIHSVATYSDYRVVGGRR
jgi:hypothetical protein